MGHLIAVDAEEANRIVDVGQIKTKVVLLVIQDRRVEGLNVESHLQFIQNRQFRNSQTTCFNTCSYSLDLATTKELLFQLLHIDS